MASQTRWTRICGAQTPTEAQLADTGRSAQRESETRLADVRAVSVTVEEAARRTGATGDTVTAAIAAGLLLTVAAVDGQPLIPAWQLATAGRAGLDGPGLASVADLTRSFLAAR